MLSRAFCDRRGTKRLVRYQAAGGTGIVGLALPWASAGLTLAGDGLLGFAAVCAVRTRTGEPGAAAGTAVVPVLLAPSLMPQGHNPMSDA